MNSINSNSVKSKNLSLFIFFILTINFLVILNVLPQVTEQWVARYNGLGNNLDRATAIAIDSSGNVYVTGYSFGSGTEYDYATIKYNSLGVEQWVARYDGPVNASDYANDIAVDSSGNVYVTGDSYGSGTTSDYATIKYNNSGVEQWAPRYNGPGNYTDEAKAIEVDSSGNVYVTGWSYGSGTQDDYATIKYNSAGVEQWATRYNSIEIGNSWDYANDIAVDSSGNVYVTGESFASGTGYDYVTIKYNSSGVEQWAPRYNGPGNGWDEARAIAVDNSGNVYVTGHCYVSGTYPNEDYDYATIKYNSLGVEQWVVRYNGLGNADDKGYAIALDNLENVYVTGWSEGSGTSEDYATIKYNSSGIEQWVARYNGPGNYDDEAYSIALDNLGNVYVTGESYGSGTSYDYATIKYNNSGIEQWVARYNGPVFITDEAYAIAVDSSGSVYVTGESLGSGTSSDYATIKYSQGTSIKDCIWSLY